MKDLKPRSSRTGGASRSLPGCRRGNPPRRPAETPAWPRQPGLPAPGGSPRLPRTPLRDPLTPRRAGQAPGLGDRGSGGKISAALRPEQALTFPGGGGPPSSPLPGQPSGPSASFAPGGCGQLRLGPRGGVSRRVPAGAAPAAPLSAGWG